jgi:hypothetical protein
MEAANLASQPNCPIDQSEYDEDQYPMPSVHLSLLALATRSYNIAHQGAASNSKPKRSEIAENSLIYK